MRYRTARVAALATLLTLPLGQLALAGQAPARAAKPAAVAAYSTGMLRAFLGFGLGLFHTHWLTADYPGNHDADDHGARAPRPDPPPEGSGLCPHGEH